MKHYLTSYSTQIYDSRSPNPFLANLLFLSPNTPDFEAGQQPLHEGISRVTDTCTLNTNKTESYML